MIAEKILNAILAIDAMSHEFTPEQWERIRLIREELKDAHVTAFEMEKRMPINVILKTDTQILDKDIDKMPAYIEVVSHG